MPIRYRNMKANTRKNETGKLTDHWPRLALSRGQMQWAALFKVLT